MRRTLEILKLLNIRRNEGVPYPSWPLGIHDHATWTPQCPQGFQRAVDIFFSPVKCKSALLYLDGIVVFSETVENHMAHLWWVLTLWKDTSVELNLSTFSFRFEKSNCLGCVNRSGLLKFVKKTTFAIMELEDASNRMEIWSSLRLCNVHLPFVPSFSRVALSLNQKCYKNEQMQFQTSSVTEKSTA